MAVGGATYHGDFTAGDQFTVFFNTITADTLSTLTAATLSIVTSGAVGTTSGATVTANALATGCHTAAINTNGLSSDNYTMWLSAGSSGAINMKGYVVGYFSVGKPRGANLKQIDSNATNGNNAVLNLSGLNITTSGTAVTITASGSNGKGINITGNGSGEGVLVTAGATGVGLKVLGGGTSGDAVQFTAQSSNSDALQLSPTGTGVGIQGMSVTGLVVSSVNTSVNTTQTPGS